MPATERHNSGSVMADPTPGDGNPGTGNWRFAIVSDIDYSRPRSR